MLSKPKDHGQTIVKRVSRRHDEEAHGGSWKVAFADFCLALMCLYLVLWVLAARQQEETLEQIKNTTSSLIDEGRGRMSETMGGPRGSLISREPLPRDHEAVPSRKTGPGPDYPDLEGRVSGQTRVRYESPAELHELAQVLASMSEQAGLKANLQTVVTPYGLRVMVHDTDREGMFELGSTVPTGRFARLLRDMGPLFAQMENQMLVVGHTDARQYPDPRNHALSNWTLSSNRAAAARGHLIDGGMPANSVLQVVGMAEQAPLEPQQPLASVNRRIELLILTSGQARVIAAMFGPPDAGTEPAQTLMPGVEAALPSRGLLEILREQLRAAGQQLQGTARPPLTTEEPRRP